MFSRSITSEDTPNPKRLSTNIWFYQDMTDHSRQAICYSALVMGQIELNPALFRPLIISINNTRMTEEEIFWENI